MYNALLCTIWLTTFITAHGSVSKAQIIPNRYFKVITMGPSGVGKSSLVNFMSNTGTEIAREGLFESDTTNVTFYHIEHFNLDLGDSPGLVDTRGYSNEEISQLIKSSVIEQSNHIISGVLLMFDAGSLRQFLEASVESVIKIFGEKVLNKMIFVFNRNESKDIDHHFKQKLNQFVVKKLSPIYSQFGYNRINIEERMVFIDTKGDFDSYSSKLYHKVADYFDENGINVIEQDQKLQQEVEKYYQLELKDPNNYKTETWQYKCHCYKDCDEFLVIKWDCEEICSTCTGSKTFLKYDEEYLRAKAKRKVSLLIQEKVYAALRDRNDKKDNKHEL